MYIVPDNYYVHIFIYLIETCSRRQCDDIGSSTLEAQVSVCLLAGNRQGTPGPMQTGSRMSGTDGGEGMEGVEL
jgi:hypothetical protein